VKGIISILLIILLLMNALGYYGIFLGLQYRNSVRMVKQFDEGAYDEKDEIIFEMPVAIPYNGNTPFQRVDGTFEYNGEFYRLIKQRFHNDTLQVVLMKDDRHREIHEEIVRHSKQNSSSKSTIDFIKDYLSEKIDVITLSDGWQRTLNSRPMITRSVILYHPVESPPPRKA